MMQLLISVKNTQETSIALAAGVDIIDLKDPNVGALGALDLAVTKEIVDLVSAKTLDKSTQLSTNQCSTTQTNATQISATIGEQHLSVSELVADIQNRADIGVDIIKIAVSDLFLAKHFYNKILILTKTGIKIVAVFFADESINLSLLPILKDAGFYGAMLDTKNKQLNLLQVQQEKALHLFTQQCHQYQLTSGLAGSLQPQYIDLLLDIKPTYIGFRGGVCENSQRKYALSSVKVNEVQSMLRNGNKNRTKAQLILGLALHS